MTGVRVMFNRCKMGITVSVVFNATFSLSSIRLHSVFTLHLSYITTQGLVQRGSPHNTHSTASVQTSDSACMRTHTLLRSQRSVLFIKLKKVLKFDVSLLHSITDLAGQFSFELTVKGKIRILSKMIVRLFQRLGLTVSFSPPLSDGAAVCH